MMLVRFGRIKGLRRIALGNTQSVQFCDEKKIPENQNEESETDKHPKEKKVESGAERLNRLLASMSTDDTLTFTKKVEVPTAVGRSKLKNYNKEKNVEKKPKNIVEAAKDVAEVLNAGADIHQKRKTESELLSKLLNNIDTSTTTTTSDKLPAGSTEGNLNDIIIGMKFDRTGSKSSSSSGSMFTRTQYVRKTLSGNQFEFQDENRPKRPQKKRLTQPVPNSGSVNLFGEEPIGIFKNPSSLKDSPDILKTWSMLEQRELKLAVTHPPRNYFEKMVLWTEQGKLWKFPIDNEQGLEEEQSVDFSEHVFLDQHLEGWCPDKGPIRHFMELVCVGLSKNPYITAQEKKEHIFWFKEYFEQKKDLLKDLIQERDQQNTAEKIQIESS